MSIPERQPAIMNELYTAAFEFSSNGIAEKTPEELGRYISGIGIVSMEFFAFVLVLKKYSADERRTCFMSYVTGCVLDDEKFKTGEIFSCI